ncbi:hypothetical protein NLJ89_g9322 [Agrocybe chaxingu]|uniref:Uncharacterized protein n=1 Tax=Agrocybe chaxingu TaxID=84603 RepID=A0A9W8MTN2_9AGAR|nr:hypothetical protein NLJ89_g9322 [Agrocybe chaxingu]
MRTLAEPPEAPRMRKRDIFKRTKSSPAHGPSPQLIAIIGFEECNDGNVQLDLLRAFAEATAHIPCPFRILFATRPNIGTVEGAENMTNIQWLDLEKSRNDEAYILAVLHKGFDHIREAHESKDLPRGWPPTSTYPILLDRAHGQAIYALLVLDVVGSHHNPQTRLNEVLQLRPIHSRISDHLGALFAYIFSQVPAKKRDLVSCILGVLHVALDPGSCLNAKPDLDFLRDVFQPLDPMAELPAQSLASVLWLPHRDGPVMVLHDSFFEFVLDKERAGAYFVDIALAHETLARWRWRQVCPEAPDFYKRFLDHMIIAFIQVYPKKSQSISARPKKSLYDVAYSRERISPTIQLPKHSLPSASDRIRRRFQSAIASARLAGMIKRGVQQREDHGQILLSVEQRGAWITTDISIVAFNWTVLSCDDSEPSVEIANLLLEDSDGICQLLGHTPPALEDYSDVVAEFRRTARSWLERARPVLDLRRTAVLDRLTGDGW